MAPLVLLMLAETGLRAAGYGHSTRLFIEKDIDGQTYSRWNDLFYHQFFSEPEGVRTESPEVLIPRVKPANTYRVFIFGGSAANGWFIANYSFWRILEVMLRTRFPNTNIEVHNLSYHGMNSHIMRHVANVCATLQPDLFVVYMGNNAVLGPFAFQQEHGLSRVLPQQVKRVWVPEGTMMLKNLRLSQLLGDPTLAFPGGPDDPRLRSVYERFSRNIEDICEAGKSAGAAVVLCTVGRNLRHWRPVRSVHRPDLGRADEGKWLADYDGGIQRQNAGAYRDAIELYERAADVDDTFADLQFRLGRCYWAAGDYAKARGHFIQAAERDASLTRANARVNDSIARVGRGRVEEGIYLVDAARRLAEQSPHQVPGGEFFHDSMHLTVEGNYVIARAVFGRIAEALPQWMRSRAEGDLVAPSLADCEERMGLTPADRIMMARIPLTIEELYEDQPTEHIEKRVAELEQQIGEKSPGPDLEALRHAAELSKNDYIVRSEYIKLLISSQRPEEALQEARHFVSDFPHRRIAQRLLGVTLAKEGRGDEALAQFRKALALNPNDFVTYCELGAVMRDGGRLDEALDAYRKALSINPHYAPAKYQQAGVWADRGDFETALDIVREVLAVSPESARPAAALLADSALKWGKKRDWEKATKGHSAAISVEPENAWWRVCLGSDLEQKGDSAGALQAYRKAVAIDATYAGRASESLTSAAAKYVATGDWDAALRRYRAAIALSPEAWYPYHDLDEAFIGHNDVEARIAEWQRTCQKYPQAIRPLFHLGLAQRDAGHTAQAIESLKKAFDLDPANAEVCSHLACLLAQKGDLEQALEMARKTIAQDPSLATMVTDSMRNAASRFMAEGDFDKAAAGYRAALALDPENAEFQGALEEAMKQR